MSIIDEEWYVGHLVVARKSDGKFRFGSGSPVGVDFDEDSAALRLAAQAPAMARLLLARVDNSDSGRDSQHYYCGWCEWGGEHKDDCALIAVLRAAGVKPQAAGFGGSSSK